MFLSPPGLIRVLPSALYLLFIEHNSPTASIIYIHVYIFTVVSKTVLLILQKRIPFFLAHDKEAISIPTARPSMRLIWSFHSRSTWRLRCLLSVTLDRSHLPMDKHVNEVCPSALCHIRALLTTPTLYYSTVRRVETSKRFQNSLARVALNLSAFNLRDSTAVLQPLHWLPVKLRIKHKLVTLV